MPQNERPQSFELGLVMAGTISGGALTAGAVEFLIQVLDTWKKQKAEHATEVPRHSVKIRAMSGASAGAMTSAIAAVAFGCEVTPVPDPPDPFQFLCVDGGLMDNEPLELTRRCLSGGADQRTPREGEKAHRAVIMIDPFPNQIDSDPAYHAEDCLSTVLERMFAALKNQARFKSEELALAEYDDVYSQFMISPSRPDNQGNPVEPAMVAALLAGFGGFFHESFPFPPRRLQ